MISINVDAFVFNLLSLALLISTGIVPYAIVDATQLTAQVKSTIQFIAMTSVLAYVLKTL